jgi:hypothetical protein
MRTPQERQSKVVKVSMLAGATVGALAGVAGPALAADWGEADADFCHWQGGHTLGNAGTEINFYAFTQVTLMSTPHGGVPDPDCTGYVEVKCHTNGSVYTNSSNNASVDRNCISANFKKVDHNARANTGTLWGFSTN